jgi:AcrR family transcriptional regulator
MKQASLYYHTPGGKEELFVKVTERSLARHRAGLEAALTEADPNLRDELLAAARWLLSQPPVDWARMVRSDMPAISEAQAARLTLLAYEALMLPIKRVFLAAEAREHLAMPHPDLLAGSFVAIVSATYDAQRFALQPPEVMAEAMIDVLLNGIRPRQE